MSAGLPAFPAAIRRLLGTDRPAEDTTGRSGARVFRAGAAFLKVGAAGSLERAARLQEFFAGKGLAARLLAYESEGGSDYLLVEAVEGCSCLDAALLAKPEWLAAKLGETARMLHETDPAGCPFADVNARALAEYAGGHGGEAFPGDAGLLRSDALVQGDFCLPNVFFRGEAFSGFIDLGDGGLGDRHFDLYWALWSLRYNLHTEAWDGRFLDAYGRDGVDPARLEVCAQLNA